MAVETFFVSPGTCLQYHLHDFRVDRHPDTFSSCFTIIELSILKHLVFIKQLPSKMLPDFKIIFYPKHKSLW